MSSDRGGESSSGEAGRQSGPAVGEGARPVYTEAASLMEINSWGRGVGDESDLKKPPPAKKRKCRRSGLRLPRRRSSSRHGSAAKSAGSVWESSVSERGVVAAAGLGTARKAACKSSRLRSETGSMVVRIKLSKSFYRRMFKRNGMQSLCSYCDQARGGASGSGAEDGCTALSSTDWGDGLLSADSGRATGGGCCAAWDPDSAATCSSISFSSSVEMRSTALRDSGAVSEPVGAATGGGCDGTPAAASFLHDRLEIRPSRIHGLGVFARSRIPEGCLVTGYEGEIIGKCTSDRRKRDYLKNNIKSIYMCKVDDDTIIDATLAGSKARYINHSCDPNCFAVTDAGRKSIVYYSMRTIEPGEELSADCRFAEAHPGEACRCGSAACRSRNT